MNNSAMANTTITKFNPLRTYSNEELEEMIKTDPTFMARDAANYKDQRYVYAMCRLYISITKSSTLELKEIMHFKIENLEKALAKLSNEHPNEFKNLCNIYGIDPIKGVATKLKKVKCEKLDRSKTSGILTLCSWGYVELYFPNMTTIVQKVAKKMYSHSMSDIEKAKYFHIFYLFIQSFNILPYDIKQYFTATSEAEAEINRKLTSEEKRALYQKVLEQMHNREKKTSYEAILLAHAYEILLSNHQDDSINADMVKLFVEDVLEDKDSLRIKEFVDLLTEDDLKRFKAMNLTPIVYNTDVRELKERIFPCGGWDTNIMLFLTENDEKFNKTVLYGWNKFAANNYQFGVNVPSLKDIPTFKQVGNGTSFKPMGYQYASSPLSLRISHENELWAIRLYLRYHNLL